MTIHRQGFGEIRVISATAPTERADGTPLPISEIDRYDWYIEYNGGTVTQSTTQLVNGEFTEAVDVDTVGAGTYRLWYRTIDTDGRESVDSEVLSLEILPPLAVPNPPTNIS